MIEFGRLSLHEKLVVEGDAPVIGHTGYFLLSRSPKIITLFHVQTMRRFEIFRARKGTITGKHNNRVVAQAPFDFDFDAVWKPERFDVAKMIERIKWWADSYDANGLDFSEAVVRKLLAELEQIPENAVPPLKPKTAAAREAAGLDPDRRGANFKKRETVTGTIIETITTEWKTFDEILDVLVERFPARDREGMRKTLAVNVTTLLKRERGIDLDYEPKTKRVRLAAKGEPNVL